MTIIITDDDDDDAVGLDKMLVDEIGDVTITNDGR